MSDAETLRAILAERDAEIAMLRRRFNNVLQEVAARDMFVRWFATEYGLATFGRKPAEMKPGLFGVGRWIGWFKSLLPARRIEADRPRQGTLTRREAREPDNAPKTRQSEE